MTTLGEREAFYLFYLTMAECAAQAEVATADDAAPLFVHRYGGLAAMLAVVAIDDFCGPEAERRLADLGWMGERALWHERVIERGFGRGPVLPARFGTLFSSPEAVKCFVEGNRQNIVGFLHAMRGQEEWGIKALFERTAARRWLSAQVAPAAAGQAPSSPGLRYLRERRAQASADKELQQWLSDNCQAVARSLDAQTTDCRQRPVLSSAVLEDKRELVLNLSVLVPQKRRERLFAHIKSVNSERAQQGLNFVLSGPWPPYSFCPPLAIAS